MTARQLYAFLDASTQKEGVGATVHRTIGTAKLSELDPFLLLDEFELEPNTGAGFPEHPHRGFETMTYMLSGQIKHADTVGNEGTIGPGDAQWMTAGSGIIHSEMPIEDGTPVRGLQLWVNLPAKDKMTPAKYRDAAAGDVPVVEDDGYTVRVIAGSFLGKTGPVDGVAIAPLYLDVEVRENGTVTIPVNDGHTVFLYQIEGGTTVGDNDIPERRIAVLSDEGDVVVHSETGGRFILVAGKKLEEPIARYGPFVMNTREEIMTAMNDFRAGRFPGQ
jgi:redox-sensitive bicupin YhaK (pirin superfamily)